MGKAEDYLREQEAKRLESAARRETERLAEKRQAERNKQGVERLHVAQLRDILTAAIPPILEGLEDRHWPNAKLVRFGTRRRNWKRLWLKRRVCAGSELACWHVGAEDKYGAQLLLLATGELGVSRSDYAWRWGDHMFTSHNLLEVIWGLDVLEHPHSDYIRQEVLERKSNGELTDWLYGQLAARLMLDPDQHLK